MIKPTVGRVVHYHPPLTDHRALVLQGEPLAAIIAFVHSDTLINILLIYHDGTTEGRKNVRLEQDTPLDNATEDLCRWMPYQTGQAAKTEQLQAELDAKAKR
jgi:hypothetical protein